MSKMINLNIILTISLVLMFSGYAQSYERYYQLTDLGRYHYLKNNLERADSCFNLAFSEFAGFDNDYSFALRIKKKLYNFADTSLVVKMIECGDNFINYKYCLKQLGLKNDKYFLKLHKKHRPKRTLRGHRFSVLMFRDQLSRSRHFKWMAKNADAKNAIKLQKLITRKPELFDRNNMGWYQNSMLEILLMHQGNWNDAQLLFYDIRKFVEEGKIERFVLLSMLHRSSLFNAALFTVDENGDSLVVASNDLICNGRLFYNNIYGRELWVRQDGVFYLAPLHPSLDTVAVNELRNFIFQSDLDISFPDSLFVFCTEEEFCGMLKR